MMIHQNVLLVLIVTFSLSSFADKWILKTDEVFKQRKISGESMLKPTDFERKVYEIARKPMVAVLDINKDRVLDHAIFVQSDQKRKAYLFVSKNGKKTYDMYCMHTESRTTAPTGSYVLTVAEDQVNVENVIGRGTGFYFKNGKLIKEQFQERTKTTIYPKSSCP